jgi:hypothetical protein
VQHLGEEWNTQRKKTFLVLKLFLFFLHCRQNLADCKNVYLYWIISYFGYFNFRCFGNNVRFRCCWFIIPSFTKIKIHIIFSTFKSWNVASRVEFVFFRALYHVCQNHGFPFISVYRITDVSMSFENKSFIVIFSPICSKDVSTQYHRTFQFYLFIYLFINLFIYLFICLFICSLSIKLSYCTFLLSFSLFIYDILQRLFLL